ncbi:MAG: hypothetical protein M1812_008238 [Candelaria pacifica]|nr:MAG: hypothetical protein M1812_008238 [Candelaria pacifica]
MSSTANRPVTSFPPLIGETPVIIAPQSQSTQPQKLEKKRKYERERFPINTNDLSVREENLRKHRSQFISSREGKPSLLYHCFLKMDLAGETFIGSQSGDPNYHLVAIKRHSLLSKQSPSKLERTAHKNIVSLQDILLNDDHIYLIYEKMEVSLSQLQASLKTLEEVHIVTICAEVLSGVNYIDSELNIKLDNLKMEDVLLDSMGNVKIGRKPSSWPSKEQD